MAGVTVSKKVEMLTLRKSISVPFTDALYSFTFASIVKPSACSRVDGDRVLLRVSPQDGTSSRIMRFSVRPLFPHLCHYFLLTASLPSVPSTTPLEESGAGPICPVRSTPLYVIAVSVRRIVGLENKNGHPGCSFLTVH